MPDVKISNLPTASGIADTDFVVINQGTPAVTKKAPYSVIAPVVNATVGSFGTDSQVGTFTVDARGRVTTAANVAINASNISTGTLPVARGGTGAATHTAAAYLKGNGTGAIVSQTGIPAGDITSGILPVARGGTGAATLTGFVKASGTNAMTASATVALGSEVAGTLPVANGGTGATTLAASGYLKGNGTSAITSQTGVPVADITGTLGIDKGGTGQATRQAAMDALAGATTSGQYLRGNGTDVVMSAIQAADVPTLNQNTTGTAAGLSSTLNVSSGGTGATTLASGQYVKGNGTGAVTTAAKIPAADVAGALAASNMPAFTGDVTTTAGSTATTLAASGVAAGTYGSATQVGTVTVDAKGRVTSASNTPINLGAAYVSTTAQSTVDVAATDFAVNILNNTTGGALVVGAFPDSKQKSTLTVTSGGAGNALQIIDIASPATAIVADNNGRLGVNISPLTTLNSFLYTEASFGGQNPPPAISSMTPIVEFKNTNTTSDYKSPTLRVSGYQYINNPSGTDSIIATGRITAGSLTIGGVNQTGAFRAATGSNSSVSFSLANNTQTTITVSVANAGFGVPAFASLSASPSPGLALIISAYCSSAGTVTVVIRNESGATIGFTGTVFATVLY